MQRLSGIHGVGPVCRQLDIAPSTYYWHQQRRLHPGNVVNEKSVMVKLA